MALNPEDPNNGFRHGNVLMFVNEQMGKHAKGPEFYLENVSQSWEEVEDKLQLLLQDSEVPREAQEACAWSSLALGVRFAYRQGHLQGLRVQWLHDFASLHKSAAQALASDLKQLTQEREVECKEASFQLQLTQTKLAEVQKERDLLRLKLLHMELSATPEVPVVASTLADAGGTGTLTQEECKKEEVAECKKEEVAECKKEEVAAPAIAEYEAEKETDLAIEVATPVASTMELEGNVLQHIEAVACKSLPLGLQRREEDQSIKTSVCSSPGPLILKSEASPEPVNIQLPDSFTYAYESPFPVTTTPSPPPSVFAEPQMPPYFMATDMNVADIEGPMVVLEEPQKEMIDSGELQKSTFRMPGDWHCPSCKAVNFSQQENCFRCGMKIWL